MDDTSIVKEPGLREKIIHTGRHTIIFGIGTSLNTALGLVVVPLYTHAYTVSEFGTLSMVALCGTVSRTIFFLGATSALSRSYFDTTTEEERKQAVSATLYISLVAAIAQLIAGFIFKDNLSVLLFGNTTYSNALLIALYGAAIAIVNQFFLTLLRIMKKSILFVLLNAGFLLCSVLTILAVMRQNNTIIAPIIGEAAAQTFLLMILVAITFRHISIKTTKTHIRQQLHFGLPIAASSIIQYALISSDRFFLGHYSSPSELGLYSFCLRISSIINILIVTPFSLIWSPVKMELRQDKHVNDIHRLMFSYYIGAGSLIIVCASIFGREAFSIIGGKPEYLISLSLLPVLMFGQLLLGSVNLSDAGFSYEKKTHHYISIYALGFFVCAILSVILIKPYGMYATAGILFLSSATIAVTCFLTGQRFFYVELEKQRLLKIAALSFAAIIPILLWEPKTQVIASTIIIKLAYFAVYIGVFYWSILSRQEKNFADSFFKNVVYKRYILWESHE